MWRGFCDLCGKEINELLEPLKIDGLGTVKLDVALPTKTPMIDMGWSSDICAVCGPEVLREVARAIERKLNTAQVA